MPVPLPDAANHPRQLTTVIWDFDGTLLPFDAEQALLRSLARDPGRKVGRCKAAVGRLVAWGDAQGLLERPFKPLYAYALRGLPEQELDLAAQEMALAITSEDRQALATIHAQGRRMIIVSCGTGDLIEHILAGAGIAAYFDHIEANWFRFARQRIEGLDLRIHLPIDKVAAVQRLGLPLSQAIAIGDGITDSRCSTGRARPSCSTQGQAGGLGRTGLHASGFAGGGGGAARIPQKEECMSDLDKLLVVSTGMTRRFPDAPL